MTKVIGLIISILLCAPLCAQESVSPFTYRAEYKADIVNNITGGLKTGSGYVGRMDVVVKFDTKLAGWFDGGTFLIHGLNAHGDTPSSSLIGDIQPVSRIEASSRTGLFQFWYRHQFRKWSLMAGQLDMNALMATNASSGNFLNTSFGMYPSVALNTQLSIYPAATLGIYGEFDIVKNVKTRFGVFDGAPLQHARNPYNVKWDGNLNAGVFYTGEVEWNEVKSDNVIGSYKLGGYFSTTESANLVQPSESVQNGKGVYFSMDRRIVLEQSDVTQGMNLFLQVGGSPGNHNFVTMYLCSGLSYKGLIRGRDNDTFGIGSVYSRVNADLVEATSNQLENSRVLIEMHYQAKLGTHFSIQPDFQYIINTGAVKGRENSFIAILRAALSF